MPRKAKRPTIRINAIYDGTRTMEDAYADMFAMMLKQKLEAEAKAQKERLETHPDNHSDKRKC